MKRLAAVKAEVECLRDGVLDPELKVVLNRAAKRLVPGVQRASLAWVTRMLRDHAALADRVGRSRRADWLRNVGHMVCDLFDTYHKWSR